MFEKIAKIKLYTSLYWIAFVILLIFTPILVFKTSFGLSRNWYMLFAYLILYIFLFIWCHRVLHQQGISIRELFAFSTYSKGKLIYLAWGIPLATCSVSLLYLIIIGITSSFPDIGTSLMNFTPRSDASIDLPVVIKVVVMFTFIPFVEELFFRGIIFNKWSVTLGVKKAIVFSALLFMIAHGFVNPWHFFAGVAACIFYLRAEGLWLPILAHMITNFISKAPSLFTASTRTINIQEFSSATPYAIGAFLLSAPFVILFFRRYWPQIPLKR